MTDDKVISFAEAAKQQNEENHIHDIDPAELYDKITTANHEDVDQALADMNIEMDAFERHLGTMEPNDMTKRWEFISDSVRHILREIMDESLAIANSSMEGLEDQPPMNAAQVTGIILNTVVSLFKREVLSPITEEDDWIDITDDVQKDYYMKAEPTADHKIPPLEVNCSYGDYKVTIPITKFEVSRRCPYLIRYNEDNGLVVVQDFIMVVDETGRPTGQAFPRFVELPYATQHVHIGVNAPAEYLQEIAKTVVFAMDDDAEYVVASPIPIRDLSEAGVSVYDEIEKITSKEEDDSLPPELTPVPIPENVLDEAEKMDGFNIGHIEE